MIKILKQIYRGCTDLPHVGSHPGIDIFVFMIMLGGYAGGTHGSIIDSLYGCLVMFIVFGPMFFYGAWDRANISDYYVNKETEK